MSTALSTLFSKAPIKLFQPQIPPQFRHRNAQFPSPLAEKAKPLSKIQISHSFYGSFGKSIDGFPVNRSGFVVKAENEEKDIRGESTMPERFRYLTKEAPDKPVRWPLLIVLAFLLYAWRTVLWELSNWRNALGALAWFSGYISKLVLAFVFHFIGDPLTSTIRLVETAFYSIRSFYSGIVAYAPIPELTQIIVLTSAVLAVAEAASPDSVNSQPYLLTLAGLVGFAAVRNYITELFFWTLLVGMFCFARFAKKRDYVSSALPVAAVLAAVGEPWVRVAVIGSYLALAVFHHAQSSGGARDDATTRAIERAPVPLLLAALAIGVRVAANWAGYRHLTWMIV
ncbi:uncharacterized protein LOC125192372 [Salvia hispanica]|uniref:uncharacterized protein LOC125192372 n=1 Tax=Salvia hispanica TaxID=49212 RepID=UPI00200969DF|nr:uncharacterized protein LOC125192372 [Salvia hispanica]